MTALPTFTPGLAAQDSDTFTQVNAAWFHAPTMTSVGETSADLPVLSLVGRVTGTGLLVLSNPAAADGSQVPVGVTANAVVNNDSNSGLADSNSLLGADNQDVEFYLNGVFNFDVINKHGSWTLASLRTSLETSGANFTVDQIATASPGTPS